MQVQVVCIVNLFESMTRGGPVLYKSGLKTMPLWLDILGNTEPLLKPRHNMFLSAVQPQKMAKTLEFRIKVEEGLYYPYSENKGADQLSGYCEAELRLCFRLCKIRFSQNEAQFISVYMGLG